MARFYFDIWVGTKLTIDDQGTELADVEAALAEVRSVIGEIARHSFRDSDINDLKIIVRDGSKPILQASLTLQIELAN